MVILPHQPLIMVDVNMPKEVYWLYPSKGFVLYCSESQSKNLLIQLAVGYVHVEFVQEPQYVESLVRQCHYSRWMPIYVPELSRYGGSAPDLEKKKVTLTCGLLEKLDHSDPVMAERYFFIW